jgi:8-amino-7-oxononanoate synthase
LHNDINHLATLLQQESKQNLLITESVFSMEGKITPLAEIAQVAQAHPLTLMVDDAHGAGVLGKNGRGICEHFQLTQQAVPCLVVPLGKAFGSMGAIVAGSKELIECLLQFSRTYRYTTALPPALAHATITALKIVEQENWRRAKLQELIQFFIKEAKEDLTPIKPVLIGDNNRAMQIKEILQQRGYFISCIRPPTVPTGTARIRISLNCLHEKHEIVELLDIMAACNAEIQ